jgi:type IV pilus assembly protein PilN
VTTPTLTTQQLSSLPRVNLLPKEVHKKRQERQVQALAVAGLAASVVVVGALYMSAHHSVSKANSDLASANTEASQLKTQIAHYTNDVNLRNQRDAEKTMLTTAMSPEIEWSHYLNDVSLRVPDNVWLTSVSATESLVPGATLTSAATTATTTGSVITPGGVGTLTFTGIANAHDDVAAWLNALAHEKGYVNVYFTNSTETHESSGRNDVHWSSTNDLNPKALSGRYGHPAGS